MKTYIEGLEPYIGTKIVGGKPMDECTFLSAIKGQDVTNRETRPGYLVKYDGGYVSWSPADVFEDNYRKIREAEKDLIFPPENTQETCDCCESPA